MISEPDQAILKKLSESAGQTPKLSENEIDLMSNTEICAALALMVAECKKWTFIVTPTEARPQNWWLYGMMIYFQDGLSLVNLSNGRLAICTWAAK